MWSASSKLTCSYEINGNPLQCSCLENPRDGGAWLAAVYGVAQSRTQLKQLSSSRFTMSCWFQVYSKVNQLHMYIHPLFHIPQPSRPLSFPSIPSTLTFTSKAQHRHHHPTTHWTPSWASGALPLLQTPHGWWTPLIWDFVWLAANAICWPGSCAQLHSSEYPKGFPLLLRPWSSPNLHLLNRQPLIPNTHTQGNVSARPHSIRLATPM